MAIRPTAGADAAHNEATEWFQRHCLPLLQYNTPFYLTYITRWPDMCTVLEAPNGKVASYSAFNCIKTDDNVVLDIWLGKALVAEQ